MKKLFIIFFAIVATSCGRKSTEINEENFFRIQAIVNDFNGVKIYAERIDGVYFCLELFRAFNAEDFNLLRKAEINDVLSIHLHCYGFLKPAPAAWDRQYIEDFAILGKIPQEVSWWKTMPYSDRILKVKLVKQTWQELKQQH